MGWVVNATHCIGGWVTPRAGLEGCGKSRPPAGFDLRIVQPVVSGYTDSAITAHYIHSAILLFLIWSRDSSVSIVTT
jgi:hypothetical protein